MLGYMGFSVSLTAGSLASDTSVATGKAQQIRNYYLALFAIWGRQHWWPAQSRFEVIVGAYLTQNTAWTNVERALTNLRGSRRLSLDGIRNIPIAELERLIRPAGYFRQKARRLKLFVRFLDDHYRGSLTKMFAQPTLKLREQLLALEGVGRETADSILLYAGNQSIFVVDAYTRRILERHGLARKQDSYDAVRLSIESAFADSIDASPDLPARAVPRGTRHPPSRMSRLKRKPGVQVLNELHALIVGVGKNYCLKSQMRCEQCPLQKFLPQKS
jgi:endonuclease-3 related protein